MYIDAFGAGKSASGAFFVYDLVTEAGSRVRLRDSYFRARITER
jgi:hypothetical protein